MRRSRKRNGALGPWTPSAGLPLRSRASLQEPPQAIRALGLARLVVGAAHVLPPAAQHPLARGPHGDRIATAIDSVAVLVPTSTGVLAAAPLLPFQGPFGLPGREADIAVEGHVGASACRERAAAVGLLRPRLWAAHARWRPAASAWRGFERSSARTVGILAAGASEGARPALRAALQHQSQSKGARAPLACEGPGSEPPDLAAACARLWAQPAVLLAHGPCTRSCAHTVAALVGATPCLLGLRPSRRPAPTLRVTVVERRGDLRPRRMRPL